MNFKSQDALTLIADYISLKNKVSTDTARNPRASSSNIFDCKQLFTKAADENLRNSCSNTCARQQMCYWNHEVGMNSYLELEFLSSLSGRLGSY